MIKEIQTQIQHSNKQKMHSKTRRCWAARILSLILVSISMRPCSGTFFGFQEVSGFSERAAPEILLGFTQNATETGKCIYILHNQLFFSELFHTFPSICPVFLIEFCQKPPKPPGQVGRFARARTQPAQLPTMLQRLKELRTSGGGLKSLAVLQCLSSFIVKSLPKSI